jgi:hypothetical protein
MSSSRLRTALCFLIPPECLQKLHAVYVKGTFLVSGGAAVGLASVGTVDLPAVHQP